MQLNTTLSPISREERNKINENWQRIIAECSRLQRQINILAGGQEVDELLERINTAVQNAEMTTAEMQELIAEVDIKLSEIQTAIINANNATDDANALNMALTALKSELEKLKSNLTQSESVRQSNEATRINNENNRISAETTRENNEQSRIDAENTRNSNEATRESNETTRQENEANRQTQFNDKINEINTLLPNLQGLENVESWNSTTQYYKNNIVEFNGSSFMALQDSLGQQPPTLPTKQNEYWSLLAQRGVDGTGAVSTVNGISPDVNRNVSLTASDVGAYVKPTDGIPSTDLDSSVQSSLEKANTALQNVPDASTSSKGIVQLNDTLTSTSTTEALTANQGKVLDDKINVLTQDVGDISTLNTTDKTNIVNAINNVNNNLITTEQTLTEHMAQDASLTQKGHVQLSNAIDSTSNALAATPNAVKTILDFVKAHGLGTNSKSINDTNLNTIAETGFYSGYNLGNSPVDAYGLPRSTAYVIHVEYQGSTHALQILIPLDTLSRETFIRQKNDGIWSSWTQIITSESIKSGNGSPEGVVTANIGTLYRRLDGSTTTTLYVKESGTGNTGWVAK